MRFLTESPIETIREHQATRLGELFAEVAGKNPFWRERFSKAGWTSGQFDATAAFDLLGRLPFTTKSELIADQAAYPPYGSNLTYGRERYSRLHQTSGTTTGVPMRWLDTPESWQWTLDCWAQLFRIAGLRPDDRLFFAFSFGPFLGFWAGFEGANRLRNFCLAGGGLTSQARLRLMLDNATTVVCCTPTYALRLAEVAAEEDIDLRRSSVRMLLVAGEPGGSIDSTRQRIESAWGARVIDHWGMTELGPLAIECEQNPGGLHVLETECVAEIIDPQTDAPVQPDASGTRCGELVITNFGRLGSPLIRYRTGDLVTSDPHPCPCGRSLLRLKDGILGRVDDMVIIRGNNVFPASIERIVRQFTEIAEYRIEVRSERSMTDLLIQLEPISDASPDSVQTLAGRVIQAVRDRLNFQPHVELVAAGSLPRFEMKGRRFVRVSQDDESSGAIVQESP